MQSPRPDRIRKLTAAHTVIVLLQALLAATSLLVMTACAHQSDGHPVTKMAAFDLQCPAGTLQYTKINDDMVGVRGCNKQAKYVRICEGTGTLFEECKWVQN